MPVKIKFKHVTFGYLDQKPVLANLNIELPRSQCVIICGENGVGKSTFLHLTAGILHPLYGKILYDEASFHRWNITEFYRRISILRQKSEQNILGIDAWEDLKLWLKSGERYISDNDVRLKNAIEEWELTSILHTPVWELSSGELKRVALAGFTLNKERYWLMDEPLNCLDEKFRRKTIEVLAVKKKIKSGMLIVTHSPESFTEIADEYWTFYPQGEIEISKRLPGRMV